MINFDVTNELMCIARGRGRFYAKKGSMVAFKGDFRFEKLLLGPNNGGGLEGALLGHLQRKITGENMPIMSVEGSGEVYLAENAYHVDVIHLDPGDSINVESENLLAFTEALTYSTTFVGSGVISQRGLFSTYLKNNKKIKKKKNITPAVFKKFISQIIQSIVKKIMSHKNESSLQELVISLFKAWGKYAEQYESSGYTDKKLPDIGIPLSIRQQHELLRRNKKQHKHIIYY